MDYAVQKAVELGVNSIAPLFTSHGNVKLTEDRTKTRHEHWRKIIIHACEQCGRTEVPTLHMPVDITEWITEDRAGHKLILSPAGKLFTHSNIPTLQKVVLLIGPEGGFSSAEVDMAVNAGYEEVSLGSRILRTETAVSAAITAVQVLWGDMGKQS